MDKKNNEKLKNVKDVLNKDIVPDDAVKTNTDADKVLTKRITKDRLLAATKKTWFKPALCGAVILLVVLLALLTNGTSSLLSMIGVISFSWTVVLKLIGMVAVVLLIESVLKIILSKMKPKTRRGRTICTIALSLLRYVTAMVIICYGLSIIGVNVSTIVASVGIVALIIGFGAESLIEDVMTGVFMLFENQYNVGDIIEVNGFRGTVTAIGVRNTSITDISGNIKIVNNSAMINILNRSENSSKAFSDIAVSYSTDIEALEKIIPGIAQEIYDEHQNLFKMVPVYLGVQELGESGVTLRFAAEVEEKEIYNATRTLNRELLVKFKKNGVSIPFPQVDVHMKEQ